MLGVVVELKGVKSCWVYAFSKCVVGRLKKKAGHCWEDSEAIAHWQREFVDLASKAN